VKDDEKRQNTEDYGKDKRKKETEDSTIKRQIGKEV
jgi:hypothetical protein